MCTLRIPVFIMFVLLLLSGISVYPSYSIMSETYEKEIHISVGKSYYSILLKPYNDSYSPIRSIRLLDTGEYLIILNGGVLTITDSNFTSRWSLKINVNDTHLVVPTINSIAIDNNYLAITTNYGYTNNGYSVIGILSTVEVLDKLGRLITVLKTPLGLMVNGLKLENNTLYLHIVNDGLYKTQPTTILCSMNIVTNTTNWCRKIQGLRLDSMAIANNTIYLAGIANINFNKYLILVQLGKNNGTIIHAYRYRIDYNTRTYRLQQVNNTLYLTGRVGNGFYIVEFNSSYDTVDSTKIISTYPTAGSIIYRNGKPYIVGTIFNNTLRRPFIIDISRGKGLIYLYDGVPNGTIGLNLYPLDNDILAVFEARIYTPLIPPNPDELYIAHWILKLPSTLDTSLYTNTSSKPLNYTQNQFYIEKLGEENITTTNTTITLLNPSITLEHPTIWFEKTVIDSASIESILLGISGRSYAREPYTITWTVRSSVPLDGAITLYSNGRELFTGELNCSITWIPARAGVYNLTFGINITRPITYTRNYTVLISVEPRPIELYPRVLSVERINSTHIRIVLNISVKDGLNGSTPLTGYLEVRLYKDGGPVFAYTFPVNETLVDLAVDPIAVEVGYYDPSLTYANTSTTLSLSLPRGIAPAPEPWVLPIVLVVVTILVTWLRRR